MPERQPHPVEARHHTDSWSAPELQVALFRVRVPGTRLVAETLPALEDAARQVVFLRRGPHDIVAVAQHLPENLRRKRADLDAMLFDQHALRLNVRGSEFRKHADVGGRGGILHDCPQIRFQPVPGIPVHRELEGGTGLMETWTVVVLRDLVEPER